MGVSKEGTAPRLSCVQDWSFVQGAVIRDVSDPSEQLFGHLFSNSSSLNLSKCPLLGDGDLLVARELELGPAEGFNHMLLVLQLGADGQYDLASVPGHSPLALSKGTAHNLLGV